MYEMILLCPTKILRSAAVEQFLSIATQLTYPSGSDRHVLLSYFLDLLFAILPTAVPNHAGTSQEYFKLLCQLLSHATVSDATVASAESLLHSEISWLKQARVCIKIPM